MNPYEEGQLAFMNDNNECPYNGDNRRNWWIGWLDARTSTWESDGYLYNECPLAPLPEGHYE